MYVGIRCIRFENGFFAAEFCVSIVSRSFAVTLLAEKKHKNKNLFFFIYTSRDPAGFLNYYSAGMRRIL